MRWLRDLRKEVHRNFPYLRGALERSKILRGSRARVEVRKDGEIIIVVPEDAEDSRAVAVALVGLMQAAMGHVWRGASDGYFHLASDLLVTHMLMGAVSNYALRFEVSGMHLTAAGQLRDLGLGIDEIDRALQMVAERRSVEDIAAFIKLHARKRRGSGACRGNGGRDVGLAGWEAEGSERERMERYRAAKEGLKRAAAKYGVKPGNAVSDIVARIGRRSWKRVIERFVRKISYSNVSYSRPQKRLLHMGVAMPGYTRGKAKIAVILDTSGSISDEMLSRFLGEVRKILRENDVGGYLIMADVSVQAVMGLSKVRDHVSAVGRGGTSFVEAIERAESLGVDGIIYFTDLMGEFPNKAPRIPVVWAVPRNEIGEKPPFGKVVTI